MATYSAIRITLGANIAFRKRTAGVETVEQTVGSTDFDLIQANIDDTNDTISGTDASGTTYIFEKAAVATIAFVA